LQTAGSVNYFVNQFTLGCMRSTFLHLAVVSMFVGAITPATAFAHGDLRGLAIIIPTVLFLHTVSLAIALLLLRKRRSWPTRIVAVLVAATISIAWWFGFLQFANNPSTASQDVWLWIWFIAPFALLAVSGASALYQRHLRRAV